MTALELQRVVNKNLIAARKKAGLSQANVAEKLSLDQSAISKYELGVISPNAVNMKKLSNLYGVDVNTLFFS